MSGSADYLDNVMTKFMINNRTDALKTDINLFFMITNCRIADSRSLTRGMNFKDWYIIYPDKRRRRPGLYSRGKTLHLPSEEKEDYSACMLRKAEQTFLRL